MNLLRLIQEIIKEGKQVGLLYHYTTPSAWWEIQDCDCLMAAEVPPFEKTEPFISTTRNKNFHKTEGFDLGLGYGATPIIRLTLDGNKLSQRFKISPHAYFTDTSDGPRTPNDVYYTDEYEERIYTKVIQGLEKNGYLLAHDDLSSEIED